LKTNQIYEKEKENRTSKNEDSLSSLSDDRIQETKAVRSHKHSNFVDFAIGIMAILLTVLSVSYLIVCTKDKYAPQVSSRDTYRPAAAQGDADAQFGLGFMYANGNGVPQDYKEAEKWFRLAAAQGDADAQFGLGAMYYAGLRVNEDYVQAYKWFDLSAAQGFKKAIKLRDLLRKKMSSSQIAKAKQLSREFHPKKQ